MYSHWPAGQPFYPQLISEEYKNNLTGDNFTSTTVGQFLLDENITISTNPKYIDNYLILQFQNVEHVRSCGSCINCQYYYFDKCLRYSNESKREYTFCSHHGEFAHRFGNHKPNPSFTYNEVVPGWKYQKFRLDLDILNQPFAYCERLKDILITIMIEVFKPEFEINLSRDIVMTDSSGTTTKGEKYSRHIILDNYYCLNGDHSKAIFEEIYKRLPEEYKQNPYVDKQIYSSSTRTTSLRIINCTKANESRYKLFQLRWNYLGQEIRYDTEWAVEKHQNLFRYNTSLITWTDHCKPIKSFIPIKIEHVKPQYIPSNADEASIITIANNVDYIRNNFEYSRQNGNFFIFERKQTALCPICNRNHETSAIFIIQNPNGDVKYGCYRNPKQMVIITNTKGKNNSLYPLDENNQPIPLNTVPDSTWNVRYNEQYMRPIDFKTCETIVMKGPMGTGKTFQIKKGINKLDQLLGLKRILVISSRITFATNMTSEYGMGFKSYKDCSKEGIDYKKQPRLFIQAESLYKLGLDFETYDLIIFDESESISQQFASDKTMSNKLHLNLQTLTKAVSTARYAIFADAFVSPKTINLVKELRGNTRIKYEWNVHITVPRKAFEHASFDHLSHKAFEMLKDGKKLFFVFGSKDKADTFKANVNKEMPWIRTLIYTRTEGNRDDLYNVRDIWNKCDLLIITSTITVGVNFNIAHFDSVFIYCSGFGPLIRDIIQAHMRIRHLTDNTMHYYIFNQPNHMEGPFLRSVEEAKRYLDYHREFILKLTEKISKSELIHAEFQEMLGWFKINLSHCLFEKRLSQHYPKHIFEEYLKVCGYTKAKVISKDKLNLETIDYTDFDKIKDITGKEAKEIMKRLEEGEATTEEYLRCDKHHFIHKVVDLKTPKELVPKLYGVRSDGKKKHIFNNLNMEKNYTVGEVHNREITRASFPEICSTKASKLEIIRWFNSLLNITHSTQPKQFSKEELLSKYNEIMSRKDEIYTTFNFDNRAKGGNSQFKQIIYLINRVYGSWSCVKLLKSIYERKMVKGVSKNKVYYVLAFRLEKNYVDLFHCIRDNKFFKTLVTFDKIPDVIDYYNLPKEEIEEENVQEDKNINKVYILPVTHVFPETQPEIVPIFNIQSPIVPTFNIQSPITPTFNIHSPVSPLEGQVTPFFNIQLPITTITTTENAIENQYSPFDIISSLKENIKQQNVSRVMPVFNILST
jgi:hypothetical protein